MSDISRKIVVRKAEVADCMRLAQLSSQLGYEVSVHDIKERMTVASKHESSQVLVAIGDEPEILGWTQVGEFQSLIDGVRAQIMALVVDKSFRRCGVGKRLVEAAIQWARFRGHSTLSVRSNAIRKEAHEFYPSLGFQLKKTQLVYGFELEER